MFAPEQLFICICKPSEFVVFCTATINIRNGKVLKVFVFVVAIFTHAIALQAGELQESGRGWKVINYWSKSCAPCRVEIPELNDLSEALEPLGVSVMGVNFDEDDRARTMQIAARMGITFPTLTFEHVRMLNLTSPAVLPTTYILAPDNTVKAKLIGAQDRTQIMAKLAAMGVGK